MTDNTDNASINCTMEMSKKDINIGELVNIFVKVVNNGNAILDKVQVFLHLPNGMKYYNDNMDAKYEDESDYKTLLWEDIGPLKPKDDKIIEIRVIIDGSELKKDLQNEVFVIGRNRKDEVKYYYKLILKPETRTITMRLTRKNPPYNVAFGTGQRAFTLDRNGFSHPNYYPGFRGFK